MLTRQQGMILPLMLLFLAVISAVVARVHSLAIQKREVVQMQVWRSQANSMIFSAEDIVLSKLPLLNIPLFQRLRGKKETDALRFTFPLAQGTTTVAIISARQCLNIAPLWEEGGLEKTLTEQVLKRLLTELEYKTPEDIDTWTTYDAPVTLPAQLTPWICYLPGAGQHWDRHQLGPQHLPLLEALLPDESSEQLATWLNQGITYEQQLTINKQLGAEVLVSESDYYWLQLHLQNGETTLHMRDLISISDRTAHIVRRRLLDDDAL